MRRTQTDVVKQHRVQIGHRIRMARVDLGLSQTEFGLLMPLPRSPGVVSNIENGKSPIEAAQLLALAEKLSIPVSYFFESKRLTY